MDKTQNAPNVETRVSQTAFHSELSTEQSKVGDLGKKYSEIKSETGKADPTGGDMRGPVYSKFLTDLVITNGGAGVLTRDNIKQDEKLDCFNTDEKKMLDFTDKHFKQLSDLQTDDKKGISIADINELKNFPNAPKMTDAFKDSFAEKFAAGGAVIGAGVEIGTYIAAPAVGAAISLKGGAGMGVLVGLGKMDLVGGVEAAGLTAAAWGPVAVGAAGYYAGKQLAQPYYNHTRGKELANMYKDLARDVPQV